jgi:protein-tyrosine kinase
MERIKEALDRVKAEREANPKPETARDPTNAPSAKGTEAAGGLAADTPINAHAQQPSSATSAAQANDRGLDSTEPRVAKDPRTTSRGVTSRDVLHSDPRHLEKHRIVAHQKHNPNSGAFDLLRTQVLHKMSRNGWNTLGVVSPSPGAGKTVVSINLALSIAQLKDRTSILLDFDLRRPSVFDYLGVKSEPSLNEVLAGEADFGEALVSPLLPTMSVIAANRPVPNSAELLSSAQMTSLLEEVKGRYADRVVIVDLPPILNADDAIAVMPNLDCILVVVGSGMSSRRELEDTLRYLPTTNLIGTVLNKAQIGNEISSYGY